MKYLQNSKMTYKLRGKTSNYTVKQNSQLNSSFINSSNSLSVLDQGPSSHCISGSCALLQLKIAHHALVTQTDTQNNRKIIDEKPRKAWTKTQNLVHHGRKPRFVLFFLLSLEKCLDNRCLLDLTKIQRSTTSLDKMNNIPTSWHFNCYIKATDYPPISHFVKLENESFITIVKIANFSANSFNMIGRSKVHFFQKKSEIINF